jgi:tRNA(Ile)-lysidine synthase
MENLVILSTYCFVRPTQPPLLPPHFLESKLTHIPYSRLFIAYSGGIDSHVLLHLCTSIHHLKPKITAVYVNHGLQVEAESWGLHCEQVCDALGVKFLSLKANANAAPGESPEEAARNARYTALKSLLASDDLLLVAQHAEDQLETVLLQLFRGSGLKGISGMPPNVAFGQGRLVRPLLDISKASIIEYAKNQGLQWIEDHSNQKSEYDRNFLRNEIIPLLKQRWPSLDKTVSRSAKHCANAQVLLTDLADDLLATVINQSDNTLYLSCLQSYSLLQQPLIIRQWFQFLGLKMPSQDFVQRILEQVVAAREDAAPALSTQGVRVCRFRDSLYCINPPQKPLSQNLSWPSGEALLKVSDNETYQIVPSSNGILAEQWQKSRITVKFRTGGETIELPHRSGHHSLKKLFQEAGIPPWERVGIPLIYLDGKLAAVGANWISAEFYSEVKESCFRIIQQKINPKGNDDERDVD